MKVNKNAKLLFLFIVFANYLYFINFGYAQERVIKAGDILEISVTGNPALSQAVIVNPDGTIDFPALQGVPVDGITIDRFQEILIAQLSRYLPATPLVFVRFGESYPIKVTVLGQVVRPGLYVIANTTTLQGAVGAAGGFIPGAQLSRIRLIHSSGMNKTEEIINLEQFYLQGDPSVLPILRDGDTVVIPGNPLAANVKVLGAVENPGSHEIFFQTTLLDILFMAGGPTEDANLNNIKIISQSGQNPQQVRINIKELLKSNSFKNIPLVMPGDVIYVSKKRVNWRRLIDLARDLTTFATLFYLISVSAN